MNVIVVDMIAWSGWDVVNRGFTAGPFLTISGLFVTKFISVDVKWKSPQYITCVWTKWLNISHLLEFIVGYLLDKYQNIFCLQVQCTCSNITDIAVLTYLLTDEIKIIVHLNYCLIE